MGNILELCTSIEKAIDEVFLENVERVKYHRSDIENGEKSILTIYELNFDDCQEHQCFRSAKREEINDNHSSFSETENIGHFLKEMMGGIRNAVNNTDDFNVYKSYSKRLAAPLFKYYSGNTPLFIDKLMLNSLNISIEIDYFDWFPSYDNDGNKNNRCYTEYYDLVIPFKELTSKEKLFNRIIELVFGKFGSQLECTDSSHIIEFLREEIASRSGDVDVDNVRMIINNMTLDISELDRDNLDNYYKRRKWFKRHASYKKDKEVITTNNFRPKPGYSYCIQDPRVLQFVRFIYILKIGKSYSKKIESFVSEVLDNKYPEIVQLIEGDREGVLSILQYLDDDVEINNELKAYIETFENDKNKFFTSCGEEGTKGLLKRLCMDRCFDEDLFNKLFATIC